MSEIKQQLDALKAQISEGLENIAGDITRLSESLTGGLSEDEAEDVKAGFQAIADRVKSIADVTPEPVAEEPAPVDETPVEETPAEPVETPVEEPAPAEE